MTERRRHDVNCVICGEVFEVVRHRLGKTVTCSKPCLTKWHSENRKGNKYAAGHKPVNAFKKGHKPWNKDLKGIHLSPDSEFKKGSVPKNKKKVGSFRIRTDKNGKRRIWIKVEEPNTWMLQSVYNWEKKYGKVPKGCIIHHIDRNPLNDKISNLACMTRAAHIKEHHEELVESKNAKRKS